LATVAYLLVGLPYALTLGFLAGLLEFIPYFGPWLGAIPAIIIAYLSGSQTFIWTLVVVLLIQQLEGVLITPRILSGVVNLHPVYVILSLWAGGLFFGIAGMFLAVPSVLILRVIIKHIYLNIVAIK
jgi:predicted PurR-regulated permease PerM